MSLMRRLLPLLVFAALAFPASSTAAPTISVQASATRGAAPLQVTLTASGDAVSYHWNLGDGTAAGGATVQHMYQSAGAYRVVVTGTGLDGSTSTAGVTISALGVALAAPHVGTYGHRIQLRGRVVPSAVGASIALRQGDRVLGHARTKAGGRFRARPRLRSTSPLQAVYDDAVSAPVSILVRPVIRASIGGSHLAGHPLDLSARVLPGTGGSIRVRVYDDGRKRLDRTFTGRVRLRLTSSASRPLSVQLTTRPAAGFVAAHKTLHALVRLPELGLGARGPGVTLLQRTLVDLRFALPAVNGYYGIHTYEAVLAAQKFLWLPRIGRVTPGLWSRLQTMDVPKPRYPVGSHIEVDKARQILFDVVDGSLRRIVHVSTGATGNTPLGVFHVYSKLPGFNSELMFDSLFFLRGFAVHGYPSVPPYPASHGCVRTPIWIAPRIYAEHGYGTTIYIYWS
jgi:PKD repeat protein